jgi:hypothetical protein
MAKSSRWLYALLLCCIVPAFLFGCGGGGSGESSSGGGATPAKTLSWNPPQSFQDGSPLNPGADLDRFEIYIKENSNFADVDNEMAAVSATDKSTGLVCTSFNLANLAPFLSKGVVYHVSIRAVAHNGLKSDFSASASFSF